MFGRMIRIEAAVIVSFDDLQPLLIESVQGTIVTIEVVENADFHWPSSLSLQASPPIICESV